MKELKLQDILLLSKILSKDIAQLVILDPNSKNKNYNKKLVVFSLVSDLLNFLYRTPFGEYTLVNLSGKRIDQIQEKKNVLTILNFGGSYSSKDKIKMHYINNPNGTIRWVYPVQAKKPHFLNLYNGSGWRGTTIRSAFKTSWKLGTRNLLKDGQISVHTKVALPIGQFIKEPNDGHWSLFTGTVGENRKLVIEVNDGEQTTHFYKVPLTDKAKILVSNEYKQLSNLQNYEFEQTVFPKVSKLKGGIRLSNVKPSKSINAVQFGNHHLIALDEWYRKTVRRRSVVEMKQISQIRISLNRLRDMKKTCNNLSLTKIKKMTKQLEKMFKKVMFRREFATGLTHGDFTPWNLFLTDNKIHVYDWELANQRFPILFDVFHFIFQSGVLIQKIEFEAIKKQIEEVRNNSMTHKLCGDLNIDFEEHLQFYLLYNISYYLDLYSRQEQLHTQANWLIDCWEKALEDVLPTIEADGVSSGMDSQIRNEFPVVGMREDLVRG